MMMQSYGWNLFYSDCSTGEEIIIIVGQVRNKKMLKKMILSVKSSETEKKIL